MRYLALAFLLACLPAFATAPGPKLGKLSVAVTRTAAGLTVTGYFTASGGADAVVTTASVTGQASQTHTISAAAKSDTYTFAAPAAGATVTVTFCGTPKRGTVAGAQDCATAPYTDQTPPAIKLDSLKVVGSAATVAPGGTIQFCALGYLSDHTVVNAQGQESIPFCQQALAAARGA